MSYLDFITALLYALNALWSGASYPPPTKTEAKEWIATFDQAYRDIGVEPTSEEMPLFIFDSIGSDIARTNGWRFIGCGNTISLNTAILSRYHPDYETPLWVAALAHEVAHVHQSSLCSNSTVKVEESAMLLQYAVMASVPDAEDALVYDLRRTIQKRDDTKRDLLLHALHDAYTSDDWSFDQKDGWLYRGDLDASALQDYIDDLLKDGKN